MKIEPHDISYAALLSLYLRFKLDVVEGCKNASGKSVISELNVKEPGNAAPHRVRKNTFLFPLRNVAYKFQSNCSKAEEYGGLLYRCAHRWEIQFNVSGEPCIQNFLSKVYLQGSKLGQRW